MHPTRLALLVSLGVLAACTSSATTQGAVNLLVVVDSSVTPEVFALVTTLAVKVSGDEVFDHEFDVVDKWQDRKLGLVYKYKLTVPGHLEFLAIAGNGAVPLVAGYADVDIQPPNGASATITLRSDIDYGDGGAPDLLPPPDLTPPPKKLGETCAAGIDVCESGFCVDSVCCNTDCTDSCMACNLPSAKGTCSPVGAGDDPTHGTCPALAANDLVKPCSTDGKCDGIGQCRVWPANTVCKPESCDPSSNIHTPAALCDGAGRCIDVPTETCTPYKCNGAACYGTCTGAGTTECSPPNSCVSSSCGKLPLGRTCTSDGQCTSGICTDGLCCDGRCTGQCEACDANAAQKGKCLPIAAGQAPRAGNGRVACAGSGTCGGTCDGTTRTVCKYPTSAVSCRAQDCTANTFTEAASCDGVGGCPLVTKSCDDPSGHPNTAPKCTGNACDYTDCVTGHGRCNGEAGCDEQLGSEPANCGSCGYACPAANQVCSNGTCACTPGTVLCDSSSPPTCFANSPTTCCRPNSANGCLCQQQPGGGCTITCGGMFCIRKCSYSYHCTLGDCGFNFIDTRFNPGGSGNCATFSCDGNGKGSTFKCTIDGT